MKVLVLLAILCGSALGVPQVRNPHGSAGAVIDDTSNDHAPKIAQALSHIYDELGSRAEGLSPCAFPFTYMGKTYHQCTTDHDYYGMYWCSTRTDSTGNHAYSEWRHCQVSDGLEGAEELPIWPPWSWNTYCYQAYGRCQDSKAACGGKKREGLCGPYGDYSCCIGAKPLNCALGNKVYQNGDYNEGTCLEAICINGEWIFTGKSRPECGECNVDGDPHIHMFDNTTFLPPPSNEYLFHGKDRFILTQNTLDMPTFGVHADFKTCNTKGPGHNLTCLHSVRYHEQGANMPIDIVLPQGEDSETMPPYCSNEEAVKKLKCKIKVYVNGTEWHPVKGGDVLTVPAAHGDVMIMNHNHIKNEDDLNCMNIAGTQGISVSVCERQGNYANLYISAMPSLKWENYPNSTLYGLCNTYTGEEQDAFTTDTGAVTRDITIFGNSWRPKTCASAGGSCQSFFGTCTGLRRPDLTCGGIGGGSVCCTPNISRQS